MYHSLLRETTTQTGGVAETPPCTHCGVTTLHCSSSSKPQKVSTTSQFGTPILVVCYTLFNVSTKIALRPHCASKGGGPGHK